MQALVGNNIVLKMALSVLLAPMKKRAKEALQVAIRGWYRKTLDTDSTTDDSIARTIAYVLSVDISDIDQDTEMLIGEYGIPPAIDADESE
jgi:hypothetical protein